MKIGRNQPCPCGSGKKYKKCCLREKVPPPEALQYRRLSEVYDKLLTRLMEHGVSVFGKAAIEVALHEFWDWPEPEDIPDEAAIERTQMLFWPWLVFNWEYEGPDEDEIPLDGLEMATIAESFMEQNRIDPESLEGKLLAAANRIPYSFHEVVSIEAGRSVTVRDILADGKIVVQERGASDILQSGDIVFGNVAIVDGVGMFLGFGTTTLPPHMKPDLIRMRRSLAGGRKWLTSEDLYEWDMDIRRVFLDMDRALHSLPKLVNTDGDPLEIHKLIYDMDSLLSQATQSDDYPRSTEDDLMANPQIREHLAQMLRVHWKEWVDEKLPALGNKTPRQAVKTADGRESVAALLLDAEKIAIADPVRASFEKDMIADVRRRLKLDTPPPGRKQRPVDPDKLAANIETVRSKLMVFGSTRLHEVYTAYCLRLCETIADTDDLNLHRGQPEIWSAAIVHAIAELNFLFDPATPNHLTTDELASWFSVKKPTMTSKSSLIRGALDLFHDDARFCAPHVTRIFEIYEGEDGYLHPAHSVQAGSVEKITPIPLKPGKHAPAAATVRGKTAAKTTAQTEDKQLPLFFD